MGDCEERVIRRLRRFALIFSSENSPAIHGWEIAQQNAGVPAGTAEERSFVPVGTLLFADIKPSAKVLGYFQYAWWALAHGTRFPSWSLGMNKG